MCSRTHPRYQSNWAAARDAQHQAFGVASNIVGASGEAMLRALAAGVRWPETLANKALGALRSKIPH